MSTKRVCIIDYGAGNLRSAQKAFQRAAEATGHDVVVSARAQDVVDASHIVLPGVGAFGDCMRGLQALPDMVETMECEAREKGKPFLGICVGMQLLFERGLEHGEHAGLGWFSGTVARITPPAGSNLKVPHMGWNTLEPTQPQHPLFAALPQSPHFYFVHSYHATEVKQEDVLAEVEYGGRIVSIVGRENIMATQFHPEKSQEAGLCLLRSFLSRT
jgi:glutamine amidotransferase